MPLGASVCGLRDGVTCLRSGLCFSSVLDRTEDFPSFWWVWFLALVRVPLPQAGAVFLGMRMYSFGMWSPFGVSSVFLSLLIANESLHCWWFLFRYSHP